MFLLSWANCGSTSDEKDYTGMTGSEKQEIGWKCKRMLDIGRVIHINKKLQESNMNMKVSLVKYIDSSISLENVMLRVEKLL